MRNGKMSMEMRTTLVMRTMMHNITRRKWARNLTKVCIKITLCILEDSYKFNPLLELFKHDNTTTRKRHKLPGGMKYKNKKPKLDTKAAKSSKSNYKTNPKSSSKFNPKSKSKSK